MAPYVARQYGDELYEVMCEVKRLFDPASVLNPGIVVGASPRAHMEHLKIPPSVDPEVDRCTECGYCEPVCPKRLRAEAQDRLTDSSWRVAATRWAPRCGQRPWASTAPQ